jgi:hypothetical protein
MIRRCRPFGLNDCTICGTAPNGCERGNWFLRLIIGNLIIVVARNIEGAFGCPWSGKLCFGEPVMPRSETMLAQTSFPASQPVRDHHRPPHHRCIPLTAITHARSRKRGEVKKAGEYQRCCSVGSWVCIFDSIFAAHWQALATVEVLPALWGAVYTGVVRLPEDEEESTESLERDYGYSGGTQLISGG